MTRPSIRALSPAEMEVLEFERCTWSSAGRKDQHILERFGGISTPVYYQRLHRILDSPAAELYDPGHVRRLRRLRDQRRNTRSTRREGFAV